MRHIQNLVAAVTRLKLQEFQGIWSLLTSAATGLKEVIKGQTFVCSCGEILLCFLWSLLLNPNECGDPIA